MKKNIQLFQNLITFCFVVQLFTPRVTQASTNADLSALNLSSGTLSPIFAAATTVYSASVSSATANITATPTAADAAATIQIRINTGNYVAVTSGNVSAPLALNAGSNVMDVKVTALDGITIKIYTITICRAMTPAVSIAITTGRSTICAGTNVVFTATPTNGGVNPTYQWFKNGTAISGANTATYSNTTFLNNDTISCILTSNATCVSPTIANSNALSLTVHEVPTMNPIAAQTFCSGDTARPLAFTGTATTYNWTSSNPNMGLPTSGTGNLPTFNAANNTNAPITTTISATPMNERTNLAYITNFSSNTVTVINPILNTVVATIAVGSNPFGISVNPAGSRVYVTNRGDNTVSVLNTTNNTVLATIPVGNYPTGIVTSPNGNRIYVANLFSNAVSVIDAITNTVLTTIPVGRSPNSICISPNGNIVYVTNGESGTISVINTTTNTVSTAITAAGVNSSAVNSDGSRLYITQLGTNTVSTINTATNTIIATVNMGVGTSPSHLTVSADGSRVYVANLGSNNVAVINTVTNTVISMIGANQSPVSVALSADGNRLYIVNSNSNNVLVVHPTTYANITTLSAGIGWTPYSFGNFLSTHAVSCEGTPIQFTMSVHPIATLSIAITTGNSTICAGTSVTFTATPTHNATTPTYQWLKNGNPISGATQSTYTSTTFANNDRITCSMSLSDTRCYTAASNAITLIVNALPTINTVTHQTLCAGNMTAPVNFTGTGTTYAWTNDNPAIGLAASGTGNLAAFAATNNTGAPITATISATAVGRSSTFAYITNNEAQSVSVINTTTQSVLATIPVGRFPEGVVVSPNSNFVYVSNGLSNSVSVINTASNTVTSTIPVGEFPRGVAVSPNGNLLYVTNSASHTVSAVNLGTHATIATIPVGMNPFGICFHPNGNQVYVANRGANSIGVISTATNTVVATIPVNAWPTGIVINPTGTRLYAVNEQTRTLTVINTATNTVITTISVGWKPIGICMNGDGSRVYVTNSIDNTVSVVNTATNTVLSTITVGTEPLGASVTPDGSRLYVANRGSNSVSVINTATNTIVSTIAAGTAPTSLGSFMATISTNCVSAPTTFTMTVNPISTPTLVIGITAGSPTICGGTSVTFTATPTNAGVTPTYQWKKNGTAISGAINATYTSTTLANNDIIQCVVSNNAACNVSANSNSVTMTVNPTVTPTLLVTTGSQITCVGAIVTFTATPTHGGTTPTYQWQQNGAAISGATNATYTSSNLANNDAIRCLLTSNETCATAQTATSNVLTMTVNPMGTPSVAVAITTGSTSVCAGTSVVFTATPTNGGANPTYQWQKNGVALSGATNATYSSASLLNNDMVNCILTSNATCLTAATATSNNTTMTIYPKPVVDFIYIIVGGTVIFTNASTAGTPNWAFGDANNSTSTQPNPSFTYTANGTYPVSLEVTSANNCKAKVTQMVNVTRVGVNDLAEALKINVLPNPFSEWLTITMEPVDLRLGDTYQIMVTNGMGQTVYQSVWNAKTVQLNTESWSAGIYNICIAANGHVIPIKKSIKIAK